MKAQLSRSKANQEKLKKLFLKKLESNKKNFQKNLNQKSKKNPTLSPPLLRRTPKNQTPPNPNSKQKTSKSSSPWKLKMKFEILCSSKNRVPRKTFLNPKTPKMRIGSLRMCWPKRTLPSRKSTERTYANGVKEQFRKVKKRRKTSTHWTFLARNSQ